MIRKGTVALITGGGKGVGAGIARVLCTAGARVCIGYNSSKSLALSALADIQKNGGEAFLYPADVSDSNQVIGMVEETVHRYGGIDILDNKAAMQPNRMIGAYDAEAFRWLWIINIGGYWRLTQSCLPYLRQSACPRIINIASVHCKRPIVFNPGYAMTKAAILMFTREAAIEFAREGITVNRIDLGACKIEHKTGQYRFNIRYQPEEFLNPCYPLGHMIFPEDVGHLVLYLASPEAAKITGAGIRLDGGSMLI